MPGVNDIPNPCNANNVTGLTGFGDTTPTRVTGQSGNGLPRTTGAEVDAGAVAYSTALSSARVAASASEFKSVVYWVWYNVARTVQPSLLRWNAGSVRTTVLLGSSVALPAATWTEIKGAVSLGTGTFDEVSAHLDLPTVGTAGQLRMSCVRIATGNDPTISFADGDTPGWAWADTPGNSASYERSDSGLLLPF